MNKYKNKRPTTASPIFAMPYGKGRNGASTATFKKFYGQSKPRCKKCDSGELERRQWNTMSCTNRHCDYKELQTLK